MRSREENSGGDDALNASAEVIIHFLKSLHNIVAYLILTLARPAVDTALAAARCVCD